MEFKAYVYSDDEVGVEWPGPDWDRERAKYPEPRFTWYDWGWDETNNPDEADIFVVRQRLIWLSDEQVYGLPYLPGNEKRHIFFDLGSDGDRKCYRSFQGLPAIFFRACVTRQLKAENPTIITIPWPVVDLAAFAPPFTGYEFDVVFKGQITSTMAEKCVESVMRNNDLTAFVDINPTFYAYMSDAEKAQSRTNFLGLMRKGRIHLVPTSVPAGTIRYRLYEGMALGSVAASLCDGCDFPFADRIDWPMCVVTVPENLAGQTGDILAKFLENVSDEALVQRGMYARQQWEKWLDRSRWAEIFGAEVAARISRLD